MNLQMQPGLSSMLTTAATLGTAAMASVTPQSSGTTDSFVSGQEIRGLENSPFSCADKLRGYEQKIEVANFPPCVEIRDDLALYLRKIPDFILRKFKDVSIEGWSIKIPLSDFGTERASREMARQFVRLLQKLERDGDLSEADRNIWMSIGSQIDYNRYCEDGAVPVFCQGVLRQKKNGKLRVEWLDQTESEIVGSMVGSFCLVNENESFSCKAKFKNRALIKIEDVQPLFMEEKVNISWIQPFQPPV